MPIPVLRSFCRFLLAPVVSTRNISILSLEQLNTEARQYFGTGSIESKSCHTLNWKIQIYDIKKILCASFQNYCFHLTLFITTNAGRCWTPGVQKSPTVSLATGLLSCTVKSPWVFVHGEKHAGDWWAGKSGGAFYSSITAGMWDLGI